jgi:hypothetical protein
MYRPGSKVVVTDQPAPVSAPTATDAWFVVGSTTYGPVGEYRLIRSLVEFVQVYGPRLPASALYDAVETFLSEGGSRLYVSRQAPVGGAAASGTLNDASSAASLQVAASSVGVYGNSLVVTVVDVSGGGFTLAIAYQGSLIEQSPTLQTPADAVLWSQNAASIVVTASGANPPAAGSVALTGGADGTYADADITTALACFPVALGPGQVSAPGRTTSVVHRATTAHALATNRCALLDLVDTADVVTLQTAATNDRTGGDEDHVGGLFCPWAVIGGLAPGTTRQVPWSAVQAGIYARNEANGVSVAQPGAGPVYGWTRSVIGLTQAYSDQQRDTLTTSGVNTARADLGLIESYGSRTLVDSSLHPQWRELAQWRLIMAITAEAGAIAEQFLFSVIDGRRQMISMFGSALTGMLIPYFDAGALYGDTPGEAFSVDVGPAVNTEQTIADGELRAVIGIRCSHMAEFVYVEIVKVETTQTL